MNAPQAAALAAAIAAVAETVALNPITLLRSQAFAGRRGKTRWGYAFSRGWRRGLPLQVVSAVVRRAFSFGGQAWLGGFGWNGWASGMAVGTVEGIAFTPTRQLSFLQQVRRQGGLWAVYASVVATRGYLGLWSGAGLNTLRMAACGATYFGTLSTCWHLFPSIPAVLPGALASAASTTIANPFCLELSRLWMGRSDPVGWRRWHRGLRISLLRSVPGAALSYALVHALTALFLGP